MSKIFVYSAKNLINLTSEELETKIIYDSGHFCQYMYDFNNQFSHENIPSIIDHILSTTKITSEKLIKIMSSNLVCNDIYAIGLIQYIIQKYNPNMDKILNDNNFCNPYTIKIFFDNRLDVDLISHKKLIEMLKFDRTVYLRDIFMEVFEIIHEKNPIYFSQFFSDMKNSNSIIHYLLRTNMYSTELFLFCVENGLHIDSGEFIDYLNYLEEEYEGRRSSMNEKFVIDLLKTYRSAPEIFHDNSNSEILHLALKYSGDQALQYIIDSDINVDEIKLALNNNDKSDFRLMRIVQKYGSKLDEKDIFNLSFENRSRKWY